ncbi:g9912 [Coccomyxa viridis]|uniref:G9912 protein n=1 Tax=Coccomyxa viridis TaxID=1274662 RepID=A0ABP1G906_9CHLO
MRQRNQKVYYSILAICYLEVLLWTTCLLSSCAAVSARPEDAGYIIRETENLKHTLPSDILELLQDSSIDLRIGYQAQQLEWLSLQRSFEATFPPETEDRPATFSFLPVLKGIPAPFTGVKAWSDLALSHI